MFLQKFRIKNFKSIIDTGEIILTDGIFAIAGQNESGKSSVFEGLEAYEHDNFHIDTLNFEEENKNNYKQQISCTYQISKDEEDKFIDNLLHDIEYEIGIEEGSSFIREKIKNIQSITFTKIYDFKAKTLITEVDSSFIGRIKGAINSKIEVFIQDEKELKKEVPCVELSTENIEIIKKRLFKYFPEIILFNDFSDILPDNIKIDDLINKNTAAKGYNAVRNIEKIIKKNFASVSQLNSARKTSTIEIKVKELSVTFQKDRTQRIYGNNEVKIKFWIENVRDEAGMAVSMVLFCIETKDGVLLEPRKRSRGMIWFLSTWLELKAREEGSQCIILYDEPGNFLHIKAHQDILCLFNSLKSKGHQILYSTHSPSLIDTNNLSNIGLVLNTADKGTIIEDLTTSKIDTQYKKDALQPIAQAMGLFIGDGFGVLGENNVILEGLSDLWYFQAMQILLQKRSSDYKLVPGVGISRNKIGPLISFCLGYDLNRLLIIDDGELSKEIHKDFKETLFTDNPKNIDKKIKILSGYKEIENIFSPNDLKLTGEQIAVSKGIPNIKDKKYIIAKKFLQLAQQGKIKKEEIDQNTINVFSQIFDRIENSLQ